METRIGFQSREQRICHARAPISQQALQFVRQGANYTASSGSAGPCPALPTVNVCTPCPLLNRKALVYPVRLLGRNKSILRQTRGKRRSRSSRETLLGSITPVSRKIDRSF